MENNFSRDTSDARLTRLEVAVQRMEEQVKQLVKEFGSFKERIENMIDDHQTTLYGDRGKPGLVGQSGTLEELRVALKGYGRDPGLIADIQDLRTRMERWDDSRKWVTRLIIGLIISDVIFQIVKLLK